MPVKKSTNKNVYYETINLEAFACIWLDADSGLTDDTKTTELELRKLINYLRIYQTVETCEQAIRNIQREKIVLISSGQLGIHLIPRVHNLPQLISCYIFCRNQSTYTDWAKTFSKIRGVFSDRTTFLKKFNEDQKARLEAEDLSVIKIVDNNQNISQTRRASHFWFQLYIEVLIRMHHPINARRELINKLKKNYESNPTDMDYIEQFEETYAPDQAIKWYTRNSCFYRVLNKALRDQEFDMIYSLRFFITDLAKELKQIHTANLRTKDKQEISKVYRGQAISLEDLELLKRSSGQYLSMNSFISTSRDHDIALTFPSKSSMNIDQVQILYEITIDQNKKMKAYANIEKYSTHTTEKEILIMCGALFRIGHITKDKSNEYWICSITLISEDDDELKDIFDYMKSRIEPDTNLNSLGQILIEMGEFDQALKHCKQMINETKLNEAKALEIKGKAAALKGDFDVAIKCGDEVEKIYKQILPKHCQELGLLHSSLGSVYCQKKVYYKGLIHLKEALAIQIKILPPIHADIAETYHYYGDYYEADNKLDKALDYYKKSLVIRLEVFPTAHPATAVTYNNIGVIYERQRNYAQAVEHYEKALGIRQQVLPPNHPELQRTEENFNRVKKLNI